MMRNIFNELGGWLLAVSFWLYTQCHAERGGQILRKLSSFFCHSQKANSQKPVANCLALSDVQIRRNDRCKESNRQQLLPKCLLVFSFTRCYSHKANSQKPIANCLTLIAFLLLCSTSRLNAQNPASQTTNSPAASVQVQGKATPTGIVLRWAPDKPALWQLTNKYGYTIERVLLMENGKLLKNPVTKIITQTPIKPAPLKDWEPWIDDDYVAVAAQAIYGESFEMEEAYSSDIARVINTSREIENRFSFALYAGDLSIDAAKLSGLYYKDEEVYVDQKYLYRIYANIPTAIYPADTATLFIGMEDMRQLPQPKEVRVEFNDQAALISWNGEILDNIYNTYWVERSEDGKNFVPITEVPIVQAYEKNPQNRYYKYDSLSTNDKTYHYRVIGVDAFGEKGVPSDTITGSGLPAFVVSPFISGHEVIDGQVQLQWQMADHPLLQSISLLRQTTTTAPLVEIAKDINPKLREAWDPTPNSSGYYQIQAKDRYGRTRTSFPYLVQLEDSIPPSIPIGLKGNITARGIVSISWEAPPESDLLGYKIFKANQRNAEFVVLPGEYLTTNAYTDSIYLENLTETIYYRVEAYDRRYNPSGFSEILELKKPDLIPPVPPVFKAISNDSLGVSLTWTYSSSADVVQHLLYRKTPEDTEWSFVSSFPKPAIDILVTCSYLDATALHNERYAYTLIAVDDDGLESAPAAPMTMKRRSYTGYPPVKDIDYIVDREKKQVRLSWNYSQANVTGYAIYKIQADGVLRLYKQQSVAELVEPLSVADDAVYYTVQAVFSTGERSMFSKKIKIEW